MSPAEMFKRISDLLTNDEGLRKLDPNFKADFNAATMSGSATGSMFKAHLNVAAEGPGSRVNLVVDLPLKLALAKGIIEKKLSAKMDEVLA